MVIILYVLLLASSLLILLSSIRINIYNLDKTNYIMIKFLIFTLYLENNRIIDIIRSFDIKNKNFKDQLNKIKKLNPIAKKVLGKMVFSNVYINKYVYKFNQTYEVITLYILSSYLKSYIVSNAKLLNHYNYKIMYGKDRNDFDFTFDLKISIIDLILAVIVGFYDIFKNKNRRFANGS